MRLFLRDHLLLIAAHAIQLALVLLIYVLDGFRDWRTGLYAVFLGMFVLTGYLGFRYATHREYYSRLSRPIESLDESIRPAGRAPVPLALSDLLRRQYRHYQVQLQEEEHRKREHLAFIHQWVHQMKTPLSVIHLTVQDRQDEQSASIREEAERLDSGLETVLYAARLESIEQDMQVEPVSIRELASTVIHEHKRLFIRSKVFPENLIDPELYVETDAKWMRFVMNQLLSNAVKYSAGTQEKVTFTAVREGEETLFEIRDRGVGIPASDIRRVFRPFFTGENGRIFRESTGMGLYLVKQICERLGHRVELESEPGQGTTVRIRFQGTVPYTRVMKL
ncbi:MULTISPECIES: sensor histidine kinase [Paenibacillus]|uniref:sensor histidine kinase n=1 Tax=Paenibacillus TaxID=44249 RepID=UPI0022B8DD28|nr:sensor histidine kinase [Paenibacillus caseinilyticus]MCZ8519601.1 sensor histidine kinase [Paenibacillus caseinilyticus]